MLIHHGNVNVYVRDLRVYTRWVIDIWRYEKIYNEI